MVDSSSGQLLRERSRREDSTAIFVAGDHLTTGPQCLPGRLETPLGDLLALAAERVPAEGRLEVPPAPPVGVDALDLGHLTS